MLSTDVATEFRGRSIAYELLPFSFREYASTTTCSKTSKGCSTKNSNRF